MGLRLAPGPRRLARPAAPA